MRVGARCSRQRLGRPWTVQGQPFNGAEREKQSRVGTVADAGHTHVFGNLSTRATGPRVTRRPLAGKNPPAFFGAPLRRLQTSRPSTYTRRRSASCGLWGAQEGRAAVLAGQGKRRWPGGQPLDHLPRAGNVVPPGHSDCSGGAGLSIKGCAWPAGLQHPAGALSGPAAGRGGRERAMAKGRDQAEACFSTAGRPDLRPQELHQLVHVVRAHADDLPAQRQLDAVEAPEVLGPASAQVVVNAPPVDDLGTVRD